jgi:hypothetical protein
MRTPPVFRIVLWLWFFAAFAAGYSGWLKQRSFSAAAGLAVGLTAALVLAYRRIPTFRAWVEALDLRSLLLLHVTRFLGIYFFFGYRHGGLPYALAVPAGVGDIIVALAAVAIAVFPLAAATQRRAISLWNVVGAMDIVLVGVSAVRIAMRAEGELTALTVLPLCLVPTFLVPLLLGSHLAIFRRLAATPR